MIALAIAACLTLGMLLACHINFKDVTHHNTEF